MTVFLCTAGTSAAKNLRDANHKPLLSAAWVENQGGAKEAGKAIFQKFARYSIGDDEALRLQLSAEIHSLVRMGVTPDDLVVLFSSDTQDGQATAEAVRLYLEQELPGIDCRVESIPGLQVKNAGDFRTKGVLNFTQRILRYIENHGPDQCRLNPTGGFKSLVPYTVLIGMIKGVRASYIFEQSSELIDLPRFPLEFARERLEPFRELLERIERETSVSLTEWEKLVPYFEREALQALIEIDLRRVTLSPVGLLIYESMRTNSAKTPFLSRQAINDLMTVRQIEGCKPLEFIDRVARNQQVFNQAVHKSLSNSLVWLKPGEHTRDRYLVSEEGWRLLVWRMVDHDEYDRMLQEDRQGNPGARIEGERRRLHEPFFRMEIYSQGVGN